MNRMADLLNVVLLIQSSSLLLCKSRKRKEGKGNSEQVNSFLDVKYRMRIYRSKTLLKVYVEKKMKSEDYKTLLCSIVERIKKTHTKYPAYILNNHACKSPLNSRSLENHEQDGN